MIEKLISVFFIIGLVMFFIWGSKTLAVVLGFTIILSYACMLFLEYAGKKSSKKEKAKIDNEIK